MRFLSARGRASESSGAPMKITRLLCGMVLVAGCSDRVPVPNVKPEQAAQQALAEFDADHDGRLDTAELERCPALRFSAALIDKDKDGKLSAGEIAERIATYKEKKIGLILVTCRVTLDGMPVAEARIRFIPEKFMGPKLSPAEGVTDTTGLAVIKTEGQDLPGTQCGFYRVEISRTDSGLEVIPNRYNRETILGVEVSPDTVGNGPLRLAMTH
jgi:EF hand